MTIAVLTVWPGWFLPVRRLPVQTAFLTAAAVGTGWAAWGHGIALLAVALLFPVLWANAPSRTAAFLIALGYHLAAARGLPFGAATYFGSGVSLGAMLWFGAGIVQAGVWAMCWTQKQHLRGWRALVAIALLAVPPFGVVGWASPLSSAGALFPGFGFIGLGMVAFVIYASARLRPRIAFALIAVAVLWAQMMAVFIPQPVPLEGWRGVETALDYETGETRDPVAAFERQRHLMALSAKGQGDTLVFPESSGGLWTPITQAMWQRSIPPGRTVILGVELPRFDGRSDNAMIVVTSEGTDVLYRQRMPVPVSMWRPWSADGFAADWTGSGVFDLDGKRAAALICYEQLLIWPVLRAAIERPDLLVATANLWWARGTSLPAIQRDLTESWAQLFGWNLVRAFNG